MTDKLTTEHLARKAYVYIRQSTPQQVRAHRESQAQQYALTDRARQLGFAGVVVIDEDLGKSGSGLVERPGFGQLLAAICQGEVGAVLALEASRLARNNRDWHHLLDLCAMTGTLLLDDNGVYDPREINDRLLLGLQGTMSEFELSLFRQRARQAFEKKCSAAMHCGKYPWALCAARTIASKRSPTGGCKRRWRACFASSASWAAHGRRCSGIGTKTSSYRRSSPAHAGAR